MSIARKVLPALIVTLASVAAACSTDIASRGEAPLDPISQACALPRPILELTRRGWVAGRSGDVSIVPRFPAYMTDRGGGWPHSGPWPYLQRVPLVFYGPGIVPARGEVSGPATLADIAPTTARLMGGTSPEGDGRALPPALPESDRPARPRLVITIVWDGGGYNVLERYPDAWPNLRALMAGGVSFSEAIVGSSPSVTPAVHTTIGTGAFPRVHGVPLIKIRGPDGRFMDSFQEGASGAAIRLPTLAELWDQAHGNRALVAMVGYEPWHLGMIGKGAERAGGDRDDAVWIGPQARWTTNTDHYRKPPNFDLQDRLGELTRELDASDGRVDDAWGDEEILDDRTRIAESPAFARYHAHELIQLIATGGYGADDVTDLVYTNFKQIDRVGHRYNMNSVQVERSVRGADDALGDLLSYLRDRFEPGEYVVVLTADHGQQPDADDVRGYRIDPVKLHNDIEDSFGPVMHSVLPTEIYLDHARLAERDLDSEDVARFLGSYTVQDNLDGDLAHLAADAVLDHDDTLFSLAIPGDDLDGFACSRAR